MIAVDTNVLVYAHRPEYDLHAAAREALVGLARSPMRWAIPWPCLAEFLAVVTSPRIFRTPTPLDVALQALEVWLAAPRLSLLAEVDGAWAALREQALRGSATGGRIHDARIAALCLLHGVAELWTADRDFGRFPALKVVNPLVPGAGR